MNKNDKKEFMKLVNLLLNPAVDDSSRDDAAMDLSSYDDPEVENALLKAASVSNENEMVADSCGESLATIWVRKNKFNKLLSSSLNKAAKFAFLNYIKINKPEWIKKYNLEPM